MNYVDSSFVVSLYIEDANTDAAKNHLLRNKQILSLTNFSKSETQHAIRTIAFRKQITSAEMTQALLYLERDIEEGMFELRSSATEGLFSRASQLSNRHALEFGVRYLDMLHVASALLLNATRFLTFDLRQRKLAKAVGLEVKL